MRFKLGHPDYPEFAFNLFDVTPEAERRINRLAPVATVARAFDWPKTFGGFRGWVDTFNALTWPQTAEQFTTCVVVIDDARNDLLEECIEAQMADVALGKWRWPYLVLSALLAPADNGLPAEGFAPGGIDPVSVETELLGWKLYPLTPINISSLDSSETLRGLWLLPLVDVRYFTRNVPLNPLGGVSSASGTADLYPLIDITREDTPTWMPPLRVFPQDVAGPVWYTPIAGQGTQPSIASASRLGEAADKQAAMSGWRVVCRDVRSLYNRVDGSFPHSQFTGVLSDYPENWSLPEEFVFSYHLDALAYFAQSRSRLAGGLADVRTLDNLICKKLQFVFDIANDTAVYSVTLYSTTDYPEVESNFVEIASGPDSGEKSILPVVHLGVEVSSRTPDTTEHATLVAAAKRWFLLYCYWRRRQAYMKFPGIYPLIPNGHAHMIRWDFRGTLCETTYIAIEGIEGFAADTARGSSGGSSDTTKLVCLIGKDYSLAPFITYSWVEVLASGDETTRILYTPIEDSQGGPDSPTGTFPLYHLRNLDLPVVPQDDGSAASGAAGIRIDELSVFRVRRGSGEWYEFEGQAWQDLFRLTGMADADGDIAFHRYLDQNTNTWEDGRQVRLVTAE